MDQRPLFVFGTLRKGEINHHYLAGRYRDMQPAQLPGFSKVAPLMIARTPGGVVEGELYWLTAEIYHETLAGCDELEELAPGQLVGRDYQRQLVMVETSEGRVHAWAYTQPEASPSAPAWNVEKARPRDFLGISALDRIAWLEAGVPFIPDGEHVWRVWCEYATVLVSRVEQPLSDSGEIAGAVVMFPAQQGELFLHKAMVHPELRGKGLGTALMAAALEQATAPVLLTVNPENQPAVHVYEKLGFRIRELIPGYYRDHEHRYLMVYTP